MRTYALIGSIVLILGGLLWILAGSEKETITNYPPKNTTIVAFGDSLVFGYGATSGNDFVSVLGRLLNREIINRGVSGNTTADGLLRVDEVLKEDPGIVLLLLGGNDYLRRMSEETTRTNLSRLIETFQKNGAVVVLLGVRGGIVRDGREAMYAELSTTYHTIYVEDVLEGIFLKPELMFDGLHPNDAGYTIIAERLYETFKKNEL